MSLELPSMVCLAHPGSQSVVDLERATSHAQQSTPFNFVKVKEMLQSAAVHCTRSPGDPPVSRPRARCRDDTRKFLASWTLAGENPNTIDRWPLTATDAAVILGREHDIGEFGRFVRAETAC